MTETLITLRKTLTDRGITICLTAFACLAIAGCQSSTSSPDQEEEPRPPVVQDMDIENPDSTN